VLYSSFKSMVVCFKRSSLNLVQTSFVLVQIQVVLVQISVVLVATCVVLVAPPSLLALSSSFARANRSLLSALPRARFFVLPCAARAPLRSPRCVVALFRVTLSHNVREIVSSIFRASFRLLEAEECIFSSSFNRGVLCACVACFLTHSFTFEKKRYERRKRRRRRRRRVDDSARR